MTETLYTGKPVAFIAFCISEYNEERRATWSNSARSL